MQQLFMLSGLAADAWLIGLFMFLPLAVMSKPELLTREEAAEYLGVKETTLACWASTLRYDLPMIRIGRLVRYRRSDLDRWLESRTQGSLREAEVPARTEAR